MLEYFYSDIVKLTFGLWQQEDSLSEPVDVRLRLHLPFADYLRFSNTSAKGVEPRSVSLSHAGALLAVEVSGMSRMAWERTEAFVIMKGKLTLVITMISLLALSIKKDSHEKNDNRNNDGGLLFPS